MRLRLIAAVAAIMLTGCATAHPAAVVRDAATTHPSAAGSASGLGSRARALALAQRLVAEVRVPPGTRPAPPGSLPSGVFGPPPSAGRGWASATRILIAPGDALAVADSLFAHAPFGGDDVRVVPVEASTRLDSPEPGIDSAVVDVSVSQYARGATLVAVRASAAWLPVRTAAEELDPARIRAVALTVVSNRVPARRQVTRTLAGRAVIARLAALINGLGPDAFGFAPSCPAPMMSATLTFRPASGNGGTVTVSTFGCGFDQVTANGAQQPPLSDPEDRLLTLARALAGS
jgi:hypothetical protein